LAADDTLNGPFGDITSRVEDVLRPDLRPRRTVAHKQRLACLNLDERVAVGQFVSLWLPYSVARRAWSRMAEAERLGPQPDWLALLYAPLETR
jgi:hypothetical protein